MTSVRVATPKPINPADKHKFAVRWANADAVGRHYPEGVAMQLWADELAERLKELGFNAEAFDNGYQIGFES